MKYSRFVCILTVLVRSTLCLCSIGSVLYEQGKPEEALAMHQKSLNIKLKVFGPDHLHTASTQNNISNVLKQQGKYKEALAMLKQSLDTTIKLLGMEHPDVATTYMK